VPIFRRAPVKVSCYREGEAFLGKTYLYFLGLARIILLQRVGSDAGRCCRPAHLLWQSWVRNNGEVAEWSKAPVC
jgi:hypothetical protein